MSLFKLSKSTSEKLDGILSELSVKYTKQELSLVNVSSSNQPSCNCGGGCSGSCTGRCGGCGGSSCKGFL